MGGRHDAGPRVGQQHWQAIGNPHHKRQTAPSGERGVRDRQGRSARHPVPDPSVVRPVAPVFIGVVHGDAVNLVQRSHRTDARDRPDAGHVGAQMGVLVNVAAAQVQRGLSSDRDATLAVGEGDAHSPVVGGVDQGVEHAALDSLTS